MTNLITFLGAALGLVVTFLGSPMGARFTRMIKQRRALARLRAIPEYKVGAELRYCPPDVGGGSAPIATAGGNDVWTLTDMSLGRVLLTADGESCPMTCAEFEAGTAFVINAAE